MREIWKIKLYNNIEADSTYKYLPRYLHKSGEIIPVKGNTSIAVDPLYEKKYNYKVVPDRAIKLSYSDESAVKFEDLYEANYLTATIESNDVDFGYGGFINDIKYLNDGTIEIDWTVDYWATYGERLSNREDPVIIDRSLYGSNEEVLRACGQTDSELPVEEPSNKLYEYKGNSIVNDKRYKPYYVLYCRPAIEDITDEISYDQSITETEDSSNELNYKLNKSYSNSGANSITEDSRIGSRDSKSKSIDAYTDDKIDGVKATVTNVYDSADKDELSNLFNNDYAVSTGTLIKPEFSGSVSYPKPKGSKDGFINKMKAYAVSELTATFANPDLFFDGNGCKIKHCEIRYLNLDDDKPVSYVSDGDGKSDLVYDVTKYLDKLIKIDYSIGIPAMYTYTGKLPLLKGAQKIKVSVDGKSFDYDLAKSYKGLSADKGSLSYTMYDSVAPDFNPTYSFWGSALNRDRIGTGLPPENDPFRLTADYSRIVPLFSDGVYSYLFANHNRIKAEIDNKLASINASIEAKRATIKVAKQRASNNLNIAKQKILNSFYKNIKKSLYSNSQDNSVLDKSTDITASNTQNKYGLDKNQLTVKQGNEINSKDYELNYQAGSNNITNNVIKENIKGNYDYNRDYEYTKLGQDSAVKLKSDIKKAKTDQSNLKDIDQNIEYNSLLNNQNIETNSLKAKNAQEEVNAEGNTRDKYQGLSETGDQGMYGVKLHNTKMSNDTSEGNQKRSGAQAISNAAAMNNVKKNNLKNETQVAETESLKRHQATERANANLEVEHQRGALFATNDASKSAQGIRLEASEKALEDTNTTNESNLGDLNIKRTDMLETTMDAMLSNIKNTYEANYGNGGVSTFNKDGASAADSAAVSAAEYKRRMSNAIAEYKYNAQVGGINNSASGQKKGNEAQALDKIVGEGIATALGKGLATALTGALTASITGGASVIAANQRVDFAAGANVQTAGLQKTSSKSINTATFDGSKKIGGVQLGAQYHNVANLSKARNSSTEALYRQDFSNMQRSNSTALSNLENVNKAANRALQTVLSAKENVFGKSNNATIEDQNGALSTAATILTKLKNTQSTAADVLNNVKQVHQLNALHNELAQELANLKSIQDPDSGVAISNLNNTNSTGLNNQKREFAKAIDNLNNMHSTLEKILAYSQKLKRQFLEGNDSGWEGKFKLELNKLKKSQGADYYGDVLNYASNLDSVPEGVSDSAKQMISEIPGLISKLSTTVDENYNGVNGAVQSVMNADLDRQLNVIVNNWNSAMKALQNSQATERRALSTSVAKQQNDILTAYLKQNMTIAKGLNITINDLTLEQKKAFVDAQNDFYAEIVNATTELMVSYLQAEITGSVDIENYVRSFNAKLNDLRSSSETIVPISASWYNTKANDSVTPIVSFWAQQPKDEDRTLSYLQLHGIKMHVRSTIKDALARNNSVLDNSQMPDWKPLRLISPLIKGLPSKGNQALTEAFSKGVYLR